jgi:hypothetical protein
MKESQIQKAILDYLAARHVMSFRMQVGAFSSEYKGKKRFMRVGTPGMADILAFPRKLICDNGNDKWDMTPFPLWLEVKSDTGKQSELQKSFQAQVEAEGHGYAIVRSIDDVEALGL